MVKNHLNKRDRYIIETYRTRHIFIPNSKVKFMENPILFIDSAVLSIVPNNIIWQNIVSNSPGQYNIALNTALQ